jgi:hypothetical protein
MSNIYCVYANMSFMGCWLVLIKIFITNVEHKKVQAVYMGFLNYNKIFDIDILNLETSCSKNRDDFDHVV